MMCRGLKKGSQPEDRHQRGRWWQKGRPRWGFAPRAFVILEKVYAVKSQDLIFIIESSCWLQYAEWDEEGKFPLSEKCQKPVE